MGGSAPAGCPRRDRCAPGRAAASPTVETAAAPTVESPGIEDTSSVSSSSSRTATIRASTSPSRAPVLRQSGRSHTLRRARRGDRDLKRVLYLSAFSACASHPESRAYYDRKRREGKHHAQALIALARQRTNVLWAMLAHDRTYDPDHRAADPAHRAA